MTLSIVLFAVPGNAHYILVVGVILVIVCFQLYSYFDTKNKIKRYKEIFPNSMRACSLSEKLVVEDDGEEEDAPGDVAVVSQIHVDNASPTLVKVERALNMYLQKNKGAASDFHLMKDVVERYCDADEEGITTQQPIPLYLGLMGTMVGIIVGVIYIAVTKGFSGDDITRSVTELMTCVAIAMGASLLGVYCTTRISWMSKEAFSKVESDKNEFYSWLQTELLPVLSGNTVNALFLLQQNLTKFNSTFQSNISGLSSALGQIKETSSEQAELIGLLQDIDIRKVAQANIAVLRELRSCTGDLTRFNQYMHSVSDYLHAVNDLNSNINEHLNRTAAIERMGTFFESEIAQVSAREEYINRVVAQVDDTLKKSFEALSDSTRNGIVELRNGAAAEFDLVSRTVSEQQQEFIRSLGAQQEEQSRALHAEQDAFMEYIRVQKDSLSAKSDEISLLVDRIKDLADTKSAMSGLLAVSREQSGKLDELISLMGRRGTMAGNGGGHTPVKWEIPLFYKVAVGAIAVLMLLSVVFSAASFFSTRASRNDESEMLMQNPVQKEQALVIPVDSLQGVDSLAPRN